MTDTEKINEEIRNYKLFKIQRLNTKVQKYSELLTDIGQFKKSDRSHKIGTYICFAVPFLLFLIANNNSSQNDSQQGLILFTLFIFVGNSIFQFSRNSDLRKKLYSYEDNVKETVEHFKNESEQQILNYESFVEELHTKNSKYKNFG
ncbi:hypothetical protein [Flavobacterium algicola]|uniref:hypothetical protein n=1 Tax=Flavobacterium algicola TaxID=556529 RepID=UPI001EFD94E8|nr:hypothetical protein [Flavobacterium algicola]MCG9793324.1 hypothetical protein [Flavobacterium algicola]